MGFSKVASRVDQLVEPVLITYNRADQLYQTLAAFLDAGWGDKVFHVLDNASSDNTPAIVEAFRKSWPNLNYHRNRWNIGGNANILRSLEIAQSEYHWVIGDDDAWYFTSSEEVANVLTEGKADIVRLGWLVSEQSRGHLLSIAELISDERLFFASISMISAVILRRSLVTRYLPEAYQNIGNSYPQLVAVMRNIDEGLCVYTVSQDYMTHTPSEKPGYFSGDLEWYSDWYATSRYLQNYTYKVSFLREASHLMTLNRGGIFKEVTWLSKVALNAKGMGLAQGSYLLSMLGNSRGVRLPVLLAIFAYLIIPGFLARILRRMYRKLMGLPLYTRSVDRSRL